MPQRYKIYGVVARPLGTNNLEVWSHYSAAHTVMNSREYNVLMSCDTLRSIEEHAQEEYSRRLSDLLGRRYANAPSVTQKRLYGALLGRVVQGTTPVFRLELEKIVRQLRHFADLKLLVSEREIHKHLIEERRLHGYKSERGGRIASMGLPTKNRPVELERCLESFVGNYLRAGRKIKTYVVDDSTDLDVQSANRRGAQQVFKQNGAEVYYSNHIGRRRFADELAREGRIDPRRDWVRYPRRCGISYVWRC